MTIEKPATPDDERPNGSDEAPVDTHEAATALAPLDESVDETEEDEEEVDETVVAVVDGYLKMQKELRSWGQWLLLFGVLHFIGSGLLSAPWGVLLLVVGAASFYFHEPAMFVIYAVNLVWAALSNMLGADITWMVLGLFQIVMAIQVFRNYKRFSGIQKDYRRLVAEGMIVDTPKPDRAASAFPIAGCLISALALLGVVAVIVILFGAVLLGTELPSTIDFMINIVVNIAVLGLGVSLAAIVANYRRRVLPVLGAMASVIVLLLWLALNVLARV